MQLVKNITGIILWIVVIAASVYFILDNVGEFVNGNRNETLGKSLFNNQVWFVMHLVGGSMALLIGPMQSGKS